MNAGEQPTVVVVDDEEMVASSLRTLLELETDLRVEVFTLPLEAIRAIEEGLPVHVVISDFMMPKMDGVSFLGEVRKRQPFAARILLTGYADKRSAIRGINEAGLYQYLEKPWDNEMVKLIVRNAVERFTILRELETQVGALASANRELLDLRTRLMRAFL